MGAGIKVVSDKELMEVGRMWKVIEGEAGE